MRNNKPYLVIVESPGKLKKLKQILGGAYEVMASMGHVTDLPSRSFGIELSTMQATYEVVKPDVAKRLRTEAKKPYQVIYLAADPDREGEAIAHHVATLLRQAKTQARLMRVTFDATTPTVHDFQPATAGEFAPAPLPRCHHEAGTTTLRERTHHLHEDG